MSKTMASEHLISKAITTIEGLYPADSDYPDTRKIGEDLIEQAKINVGESAQNWRQLPLNVLTEYARLCEETESTQMKELIKEARALPNW